MEHAIEDYLECNSWTPNLFLHINKELNCSVSLYMSLWVLLHGVGSLSLMKVFKRKLSGHLVEILERGFKHQFLLWLLFSGPIMSNSSFRASLSLTISRVCSSSCPLHQWCYPAISSSDALFSFCLQSFPESLGLFQWIGCSHQVTKILELQFSISPPNEWVFRADFL